MTKKLMGMAVAGSLIAFQAHFPRKKTIPKPIAS